MLIVIRVVRDAIINVLRDISMYKINVEMRIRYPINWELDKMIGVKEKINEIRHLFDFWEYVNVVIIADSHIKKYHLDNIPEWVVAFAEVGTIYVFEKLFTDFSIDYQFKIFVHEFVHLASTRYKAFMPLCLFEGLAMLLAEQKEEHVDINNIIERADMDSLDYNNKLFYVYAYNITKEIIKRKSIGEVIEYFKENKKCSVIDLF